MSAYLHSELRTLLITALLTVLPKLPFFKSENIKTSCSVLLGTCVRLADSLRYLSSVTMFISNYTSQFTANRQVFKKYKFIVSCIFATMDGGHITQVEWFRISYAVLSSVCHGGAAEDSTLLGCYTESFAGTRCLYLRGS
jgi:hypothetical protein